MPSGTPRDLPPPWKSFLQEVDHRLAHPVEIHCLGGFAVAFYYVLPRATNDLDYIEVVPRDASSELQRLAGAGSELARRHRLHFQHVGVASVPEGYVERLVDIGPRDLLRLRLRLLEPHDLALSKLARHSPVDREDIAELARAVPLDPALLRTRYRDELRPVAIGDPARHDRTLDMWIEAYFPPG